MTKKERDEFVEVLAKDEHHYSTFLTHCAFALIIANWAFIQNVPEHAIAGSVASLICAVVFLLIRGMRHRLNLAHLNEILSAEKDTSPVGKISLARKKLTHTPYARMSSTLHLAELPILISSAVLFITCATIKLMTLL